jgi:hypothetical protein
MNAQTTNETTNRNVMTLEFIRMWAELSDVSRLAMSACVFAMGAKQSGRDDDARAWLQVATEAKPEYAETFHAAVFG